MAVNNFKYHKLYITLASVLILAVGVFLGTNLSPSIDGANLEAVKIGLSLTTITILLIVGSYVLDIKKSLESKKKR